MTPHCARSSPDRNRSEPTQADALMSLSVSLPKNAAPSPRKRIPRENAHWTPDSLQPMWDEMSPAKFVNA